MKTIIIGGAGFIGSHFVDRLLSEGHRVTIYDNLSSGKAWHYSHHKYNPFLKVITADAGYLNLLLIAMPGHDLVIHLASNPDISRALTDPTVDFYQGTMLMHQVLEAMRLSGVKKLIYASGSGVYGDLGETEIKEDHGPLLPVSTYGASKLAGEALVSAYCAMFGIEAQVFRFANVVGPRQTHGIGYDFVRRLQIDPSKLTVLGDGQQKKSYIHVSDVIDAVMLAHKKATKGYEVYNVATDDYLTVKEIAILTIELMRLGKAGLEYTGGRKGWNGDVPIVSLNTERIRSLGWQCNRTSREAITDAIKSLMQEIKK